MNELVHANGSKENDDYRKNFLYVASRASSHHLAYHRDLLLLLSLNMDIEENSLALDLGTSSICCRYVCIYLILVSLVSSLAVTLFQLARLSTVPNSQDWIPTSS